MSDETAIQEDVVEEEVTTIHKEDVEQKPVLARDSAMQEIAKRRKEMLAEEMGEPEAEEIVEEEGEERPAEPEMVELKINGETIQKPKAEVDAEGGKEAMQKRIAGEQKLAQAAEERKELARKNAEFERRQQEFEREREEFFKRQKEPPQEKKSDVTDEQVAIAKKKWIEAVYSGDETEAEQALDAYESLKEQILFEKFRKTSEQPKFDLNEVVSKTTEKVGFQTSRERGLEKLQSDYSHLTEDRNLYQMVDQATARIMQEQPTWKPEKIIVEAAKEVDEWVSRFKPEEKPDTIRDRQEKKKTIDNVPTAKARQPGKPAPKAKTPQEIFEEMRRGRSQ